MLHKYKIYTQEHLSFHVLSMYMVIDSQQKRKQKAILALKGMNEAYTA